MYLRTVGLAGLLFSGSVIAQGGTCPTSFSYTAHGQTEQLVFGPLAQKAHTRAVLEEIYQQLKECVDPKNGPVLMLVSERLGRFLENTSYMKGMMMCFKERDPYVEPFPQDFRFEATVARMKAYACARAAGWPTATDSPPSPGKEKATSTPSSLQTGTPSTGKTPPALERARANDEEQHEAYARLVGISSQYERDLGSFNKRRVPVKQDASCLLAVNIRQDSTVKKMFWYSIHNRCNYPVRAVWCDGPGCKPVSKAWVLKPEESVQSWMHSERGLSGVKFSGTSCPWMVGDKPVLYDQKVNQCWTWSD
jgi:hypothetical protein